MGSCGDDSLCIVFCCVGLVGFILYGALNVLDECMLFELRCEGSPQAHGSGTSRESWAKSGTSRELVGN